MMTHKYQIKGMHCPSCETKIQEVINRLHPVQSATVSLKPPEATITMKEHVSTDALRSKNKQGNMKKTMILLAAATMLAATSGTVIAEEKKPAAVENATDKKAKPYPLDKCIVTDEKLGEHGKPNVLTHEGQEIKLCCKGCLKDFKKEPAKYLKKIEGAKKEKHKSQSDGVLCWIEAIASGRYTSQPHTRNQRGFRANDPEESIL